MVAARASRSFELGFQPDQSLARISIEGEPVRTLPIAGAPSPRTPRTPLAELAGDELVIWGGQTEQG